MSTAIDNLRRHVEASTALGSDRTAVLVVDLRIALDALAAAQARASEAEAERDLARRVARDLLHVARDADNDGRLTDSERRVFERVKRTLESPTPPATDSAAEWVVEFRSGSYLHDRAEELRRGATLSEAKRFRTEAEALAACEGWSLAGAMPVHAPATDEADR